ncbi:hypothetical protein B4N89_23485 [Embleya scabrispora]|uniref:Uncharacterized protein n=1 Tax=Embleya scabrispora TaxID=159449 RepID=A0A1T3P3I6_9ACTN|nr:hypothetical protein [Embleya scabrispora]OPC83502.1 hypothetical protein B4N89_23485 [Embleya scabrispora]
MIGFEERALEELKSLAAGGGVPAVEPAQPVRRATSRRRRIGYGLAASVVLAAGIGVGAPMLSGGSAEARPFEVVKRPDGGILFKVDEFRNPKGLEQRLRDLGVRAVVDYVPYGKQCAPGRYTEHRLPDGGMDALYHWLPSPEGRLLTDEELDFYSQGWTEIRPELMPSGATLVITATLTKVSAKDLPDAGDRDGRRVHNADSSGSTNTFRLADGPVAPCALVDDPTGRGPWVDDGPERGASSALSAGPAR